MSFLKWIFGGYGGGYGSGYGNSGNGGYGGGYYGGLCQGGYGGYDVCGCDCYGWGWQVLVDVVNGGWGGNLVLSQFVCVGCGVFNVVDVCFCV